MHSDTFRHNEHRELRKFLASDTVTVVLCLFDQSKCRFNQHFVSPSFHLIILIINKVSKCTVSQWKIRETQRLDNKQLFQQYLRIHEISTIKFQLTRKRNAPYYVTTEQWQTHINTKQKIVYLWRWTVGELKSGKNKVLFESRKVYRHKFDCVTHSVWL